MKKLFKIIPAICACMCLSLCALTVTASAEEDYAAKPDDYYDYVQNFTDVKSVNNAFHAYYFKHELGSAKAEEVVTDKNSTEAHWYIEDGVLTRINDITPEEGGGYETHYVAVLSFTKDAYLNFELSVDFNSGTRGLWPVVGLRQVEEGKYYLDDGAGVFVQDSGSVTMWGTQGIGGPYVFGTANGYSRGWHNMQIKVLGDTLSVSIDNQPWCTRSMLGHYETGYVSLFSVNNDTQYRNFRIKALAEPEKEPTPEFGAKEEADTDDALSKLAGEVKPAEERDERAGKINSDLIYTEEREVTVGGGCGSTLGGVELLAGLGLVGAMLLKKKKQ